MPLLFPLFVQRDLRRSHSAEYASHQRHQQHQQQSYRPLLSGRLLPLLRLSAADPAAMRLIEKPLGS